MQATLTFNLNDPEDKAKYDLHNQAEGMLWVLMDLSGRYSGGNEVSFRNLLKYSKLTESQHELIEELQSTFYDLLKEHKVDLDVLP